MRPNKLIERSDAGRSRIQFFAFMIGAFVAVAFSCFFAARCLRSEEPGAIELESRINPNNASTASLVRLPQIGSSRAAAIIAYRESISSSDASSRAAFHNCDDLRKVKGIGPKTVKNLREWLKFE